MASTRRKTQHAVAVLIWYKTQPKEMFEMIWELYVILHQKEFDGSRRLLFLKLHLSILIFKIVILTEQDLWFAFYCIGNMPFKTLSDNLRKTRAVCLCFSVVQLPSCFFNILLFTYSTGRHRVWLTNQYAVGTTHLLSVYNSLCISKFKSQSYISYHDVSLSHILLYYI